MKWNKDRICRHTAARVKHVLNVHYNKAACAIRGTYGVVQQAGLAAQCAHVHQGTVLQQQCWKAC
eukprot:10121-Heterococcus_DN1.PRE.2